MEDNGDDNNNDFDPGAREGTGTLPGEELSNDVERNASVKVPNNIKQEICRLRVKTGSAWQTRACCGSSVAAANALRCSLSEEQRKPRSRCWGADPVLRSLQQALEGRIWHSLCTCPQTCALMRRSFLGGLPMPAIQGRRLLCAPPAGEG